VISEQADHALIDGAVAMAWTMVDAALAGDGGDGVSSSEQSDRVWLP
jgi:hypothetical protein